MKHLNKTAKKVFLKLIDGLDEPGSAKKVHNDDSFMAVHLDRLYDIELGSVYAIGHSYLQNGDVMKDPDMCFLYANTNKEVYPMTFEQSLPPIYQEGLRIEAGQCLVRKQLQREMTSFANTWMRNIKEQQGL